LRRTWPDRFQRLTAFLNKNDLENTYDHGDGGSAFEARMATVKLPPPLRLWDGSDDGALRYRFSRLREQHHALAKKNKELRKRLAAAEKKDTVLSRRLTELERQVARVNNRMAATEKRVVGIDRRVLVRIGPALRRRIRRTKVK
jgi:hypothetical protein